MSDEFVTGGDEDMFDPVVAARAEDTAHEAQVERDEAVVKHIRRTKEVYSRIFVSGNATADDVKFVMQDLAWFCKAYDPQWSKDPREQDRFVARREVYQRIVEYTRLDHDTLVKRYAEAQG